jgi:hypothetical protein
MVGNAIKIIQWLYNKDKDELYEIRKYKKQRNKEQNKKYWKLIGEMSLKTKLGTEEIHFNMLKSYSQRYEILVPSESHIRGIEYYEQKSTIKKNGKEFNVYHVYTPSHELNESEFAILLQGLCEECKQLGIDTRSPDEIAIDEQLDR